jgi:hypothetical protein
VSLSERAFAIVCSFDHFAKTQPRAGFVIIVLLRNTGQISTSLSDDNEAISDGLRVPQHQKRVLVKNLLR